MYKRKPNTLFRQIGNEFIFIDYGESRFYSLNIVASRILQMLGSPKDVYQISERVSLEFEVPYKKLLQDIRSFLQVAVKRGLVKEVFITESE